MTRGTFANVRIKNLMLGGRKAATIAPADGQEMSIYDAAAKHIAAKTPLIVLAGQEYGTGSSRDWAAKGTNLLGVKVVVAQPSFEASPFPTSSAWACCRSSSRKARRRRPEARRHGDLRCRRPRPRSKPQQDLTLKITRKSGAVENVPVRCRIDAHRDRLLPASAGSCPTCCGRSWRGADWKQGRAVTRPASENTQHAKRAGHRPASLAKVRKSTSPAPMAETAKPTYLVNADSRPRHGARIDGRACFQNSTCLRDFVTTMFARGRRGSCSISSSARAWTARSSRTRRRGDRGAQAAAPAASWPRASASATSRLMRSLGLHRLLTIDAGEQAASGAVL